MRASGHGNAECIPSALTLTCFLEDIESDTDSPRIPSRLMKKGECRGAKPHCRETEGVPQIICSPFLARKGVRGMVERIVQHPARSHRARRET